MSDFTADLCEGTLKVSQINLNPLGEPVWVEVSHTDVERSNRIARQVIDRLKESECLS